MTQIPQIVLKTIREVLREAQQQLQSFETAKRDSELLLCQLLECEPMTLLVDAEFVLTAAQQQQFESLILQRKQGQPVAYLMGQRGFWSLDLQVTPATLIPRPDTECLVTLALGKLKSGDTVADLGTGSGAIALALASERADIKVIATDSSSQALAVAKANATRLGLSVQFIQADWLSHTADKSLDMLVSNPPYIEQDDAHLTSGDLRFEPLQALASGVDGLDAIRAIVADAPRVLKPGAWLLLEHGYQQSAAVQALIQQVGFQQISAHRDFGQQLRVVMAQWPEQAELSGKLLQ